MIKVVVGRDEVRDYLLCEKAVLDYWDSDVDAVAVDRYLSVYPWRMGRAGLSRLFDDLRRGMAGDDEEFTVEVGPAVNDIKWVMYRFVFDRDYAGVVGSSVNPPLEKMGVAFYTMFWPLARKISLADRNVVRIVY